MQFFVIPLLGALSDRVGRRPLYLTGAVRLLGDTDAPNTTAVAIYMTVASILTIAAVLATRETARSSLRHDRVLTTPPANRPAGDEKQGEHLGQPQ